MCHPRATRDCSVYDVLYILALWYVALVMVYTGSDSTNMCRVIPDACKISEVAFLAVE